MPVDKLKAYLDDNKVKYRIISHSPAYTAQEVAASAHVRGRELAKTVMVKIDGNMAMVVLPASQKINLGRLKKACAAREVCLASETEFKDLFPDSELGAMPPFGNLYSMDVYVGEALTLDEEIAFNAGSHTELMRLAYADFERLVKPRVTEL
ncbi:MAG: aminoacyl-tRNA deacylase [Gammaproteobacteria bacterium]